MNEFYPMPAMPEGVEEGILKGMYRFRPAENQRAKIKAHLLGSGTILNEAIKAQQMLEEEYGVAADVWSVTSYKNCTGMPSHRALEYAASRAGRRRRPYLTAAVR